MSSPIAADLGLMQCTFCSRERGAGARLIQGPGVSICTECAATALQSEGYLVLQPGDASPLGELVRSSVANMRSIPQESRSASLQKLDLVIVNSRAVGLDPAIRQWVDRGRG